MQGHGLGASTNANLNHTSLNLVGHIDTSLKAGRALPVERTDCCGLWEAGHQASCTHLRRTTTRGKYSTNTDILDQTGINLGSVDDASQCTGQQVCGLSIFEATLATLCECSPETCGYDDLVRAAH
jgi:hypothetical protein